MSKCIGLFIFLIILISPASAATSVTASDGVRYELATTDNTNIILMRSGESRYVGFVCTNHSVSLIEMRRDCVYDQKIAATETGIRLLPPGQETIPPTKRLDVIVIMIGAVMTALLFLLSYRTVRQFRQSHFGLLMALGLATSSAMMFCALTVVWSGISVPISWFAISLIVISCILSLSATFYGAPQIVKRKKFTERMSLATAIVSGLALATM